MAQKSLKTYLAIDVGKKRVGLALGNSIARISSAYAILDNDVAVFDKIGEIVSSERIDTVIVGLPRDASGQKTDQTAFSVKFANDLKGYLDCDLEFADESLSTIRAESESKYRSSNSSKYFDDVAACYILEEFFGTNQIQ